MLKFMKVQRNRSQKLQRSWRITHAMYYAILAMWMPSGVCALF